MRPQIRTGPVLVALTVLCLLHVPASAQPQQSDTLGKTPAQIAAMGIEKWTDLYCKKHQWSTASEADAAEIFGHTLRRVNDRRIAASSLSPSARASLAAVRQIAPVYSSAMLEIAARDGGTLWIPMRAGIETGTEELVATLLPLLRQKTAVPTAARREKIRVLTARIEAGLTRAADIVKEPEYAAQAANLRKARASFETVKEKYGRAEWPGSVAVLQWYAARAGEK